MGAVGSGGLEHGGQREGRVGAGGGVGGGAHVRDEEMERVGALGGERFLHASYQHKPAPRAVITHAVLADMALDLLPAHRLPQFPHELAAGDAPRSAAEGGGVVPPLARTCGLGGGGGGGARGGVGGVEVLEEGGGGEVGLGEEGECGVGEVALLEVEVDEDVDLDAAELHRGVGGRGGGGGHWMGGWDETRVAATRIPNPKSQITNPT